ncbi:MAG: carboxypeptidase-like regulatory domain-containing protein [Bacteroidetes bacterium]|nr:carboxypeptidase-like regulatory domain-containing protein [Bacteroidota bacterium]
MLRYIIVLFLAGYSCCAFAARISGVVRDEKGNVLPYSSLLVKGTTRGVTANSEGKYVLDLVPGSYTIVCQYVGYGRQEKKVTLTAEGLVLDFVLSPQQLSMAEVVVRPGGEDPAYEIIRQAIKKRKDYEEPLDSFTCEAYIKTLMKTRKLPKRILGQKIEDKDKKEMGVDSVGKGIIYLSENLTKVAFKRPGKVKLEVLSGRESGSNGYGFSLPTFINFYQNNVNVLSDRLNPRGFVSPIADAALNYYKYKYLGSFFEDGKEVNKIQVIPRRKYEPLFSGTIDIVDGEWRIHGLDLLLLKESQLQLMDTMEIRQIHAPVEGKIWQVKDQVVYFTMNLLGIDMVGNFVNVYNSYDIHPNWKKKYFNNVLVRYDTAVNKKTKAYWDSIRPLPLEPDEKENYIIRDSIYEVNRDSAGSKSRRDSLLKRQGHIKAGQVLLFGVQRSNYKMPRPLQYSFEPLLRGVEYNTVEGINVSLSGTVGRALADGKSYWRFSPHVRYGFHNTLLNIWGETEVVRRISKRTDDGINSSTQTWSLAGGKRVSQFNGSGPIGEDINSIYTLLWGRNYMKIYENYFAQAGSTTRFDNGLRLNVRAWYEDRIPVGNTTDYTWAKTSNTKFTPNYPVEQLPVQFPRHQAVVSSVSVEYQPGQKFMELPRRKVSLGSKYPTFTLMYQKGWSGVLGSDVNFDKWRFLVSDDMNLKLRGELKYRLSVGGFLNTRSVFIQDYQHFNGNQVFLASEFLNSFQLAPYYANSTTASFYATGHLEHHFNGFLTNKIPPFRQLNWFLVGGANAFYVNSDNNYFEVFAGMENIFKVIRVDWVTSWLNGRYSQMGVRVGFGGLIGGGMGRRR